MLQITYAPTCYGSACAVGVALSASERTGLAATAHDPTPHVRQQRSHPHGPEPHVTLGEHELGDLQCMLQSSGSGMGYGGVNEGGGGTFATRETTSSSFKHF
jgi:hypothetical protein